MAMHIQKKSTPNQHIQNQRQSIMKDTSEIYTNCWMRMRMTKM